jgi:predicted transposase YdaD
MNDLQQKAINKIAQQHRIQITEVAEKHITLLSYNKKQQYALEYTISYKGASDLNRVIQWNDIAKEFKI